MLCMHHRFFRFTFANLLKSDDFWSHFLSYFFLLPNILIMNRFWWKLIWMFILWICKYFILIYMTSNIIEGHTSSSNFSVNPTLPLLHGPLMLPLQIVWISFFFSLSKSSPLIALNANLWTFSFLFLMFFSLIDWGNKKAIPLGLPNYNSLFVLPLINIS